MSTIMPIIKNDMELDEVVRQLKLFLTKRHMADRENREDDFPLDESLRIAKEFREWIGNDPGRFDRVAECLRFSCDPMEWLLNDLPWKLQQAGEIDEMIAHAHRFAEVASPDNFLGDLALSLAEAGRLDEALDQARVNLERFPDDAWTVIRAGDVHQTRGEFEQAESSYRKALAMGEEDNFTRDGVLERLMPMLCDLGRPEDADALEREDQVHRQAVKARKSARISPCPCGSGKKFKRCCGP